MDERRRKRSRRHGAAACAALVFALSALLVPAGAVSAPDPGGEAQLLAKLKTCWEYLLPELDKKQRKAILKSNRLDGYLRAVEEALR